MNIADLIRRADELRAEAKILEKVPGSGYHDEDRNIARPDRWQAPQRNGLPRLSEHCVYFTDDIREEVIFVGDDCTRVFTALMNWKAKAEKSNPSALTGTERVLLTRILPYLEREAGDENSGHADVLRIRLSQWNDVLFALCAQKIGVSGLPLEE